MFNIFVHYDQNINQISVNITDPISIMHEKINFSSNYLIYFKGFLLMRQFSFKFYKINNNDHIYILKINLQKIKGNDNTINFIENEKRLVKIEGYDDPFWSDTSFQFERSRFNDLRLIRFEERAYSKKKVICFLRNLEQEQSFISKEKISIPPQSISPSTEILPLFWSKTSTPK